MIMKKQIILLFLIMTSVIVKAYDAKINGIYYNLDSNTNTATVTYLYNDETSYTGDANKKAYSGDVVIPNEVYYNDSIYIVTSIGENAFWNCYQLKTVIIPSCVTSIGIRAFNHCSSLSSIKLPDGVTTIGDAAFAACSNLKTINIPNGVTSISYNCFHGCSSLSSINLPNSVTSIDGWAFRNCSKLTSIYISQNVTYIDKTAFEGCSNLSNINVPVIDNSAFCNNKVVKLIADLLNKA